MNFEEHGITDHVSCYISCVKIKMCTFHVHFPLSQTESLSNDEATENEIVCIQLLCV